MTEEKALSIIEKTIFELGNKINSLENENKKLLIENKRLETICNTRSCEELNPDFAIGEQVLLTKNTVVTIETFCEDGMIEIDDNNEYYKVDKDELTKRV